MASEIFGLAYFWQNIFVQQDQSSHPCDTRARPAAACPACWHRAPTAELVCRESPERRAREPGLSFASTCQVLSEVCCSSAFTPCSLHMHKTLAYLMQNAPLGKKPLTLCQQDPSQGGSWCVNRNMCVYLWCFSTSFAQGIRIVRNSKGQPGL